MLDEGGHVWKPARCPEETPLGRLDRAAVEGDDLHSAATRALDEGVQERGFPDARQAVHIRHAAGADRVGQLRELTLPSENRTGTGAACRSHGPSMAPCPGEDKVPPSSSGVPDRSGVVGQSVTTSTVTVSFPVLLPYQPGAPL